MILRHKLLNSRSYFVQLHQTLTKLHPPSDPHPPPLHQPLTLIPTSQVVEAHDAWKVITLKRDVATTHLYTHV